MNRDMSIGIGLTILGGILWGLSGTCAQFLQQNRGIDAEWLGTVRMLIASAISLSYCFAKLRMPMFKIFTNARDTFSLVIFGVFGMALCQYAYFRSIYYAGVGIATVLQYLAPTLIIVYYALIYRKKPSVNEILSVIFATIGTALIALKGGLDMSVMNFQVLFWGLVSAAAVAVYSTQPVGILRKYGSGAVVALGMFFGGAIYFIMWHPLYIPGVWDIWTYAAMFGLIVLGTVVAFNAYLEGVWRIGAVKGSIIASVEPISAGFFGWTLLDNQFTLSDMIGFTLILSTIFILAREKSE